MRAQTLSYLLIMTGRRATALGLTMLLGLLVLVGAGSATAAGSPSVSPGSWTYNCTGNGVATLNLSGQVNPNGSSTSYWWEYGPSTTYGQSTSPQQLASMDSSFHPVSASIANVATGEYHFRLVASNSSGTTPSYDFVINIDPAQCGNGPQPPTTQDSVAKVTLYVDPTGGLLLPQEANDSVASIQNSGRVTIRNHVSGKIVYQRELEWNSSDGRSHDYWSFDSRNLPAGLYDYCGTIDPGFGYGGSTTCRSYFSNINKLYQFKRGRNRGGQLRVPLQLDPALFGQSIKVKVTWFKAARRPPQKSGWNSAFNGWRKTSSRSYRVTLQPGQVLHTGQALRNNRRVIVSFSFPEINGTSRSGGDDTRWASARDCSVTMHGRVTGPMTVPSKELRRADFLGKQRPCALRPEILG